MKTAEGFIVGNEDLGKLLTCLQSAMRCNTDGRTTTITLPGELVTYALRVKGIEFGTLFNAIHGELDPVYSLERLREINKPLPNGEAYGPVDVLATALCDDPIVDAFYHGVRKGLGQSYTNAYAQDVIMKGAAVTKGIQLAVASGAIFGTKTQEDIDISMINFRRKGSGNEFEQEVKNLFLMGFKGVDITQMEESLPRSKAYRFFKERMEELYGRPKSNDYRAIYI